MGNPAKRRLPVEPPFGDDLPCCPEHLSAEAKREWNRIVPELRVAGVLKSVDRAALAAYCDCWALWVEASKHLAGRAGKELELWLRMRAKALEQMHKFLTGFGMDPASRVRLATLPDQKKDSLEEFIAKPSRSAS
jgi:P27 family predicted phage terminase small subunit